MIRPHYLSQHGTDGFIVQHWYGGSFSEFKTYVVNANKRFPKYKLVITEFALQNPKGGQAAQISFYKQAFTFLDSVSYVQLYFPFVAYVSQHFLP